MSFDDLFLRLTVDLYNNQKLFHSWNMVFVYIRIYKTDLESIHQTFSRGSRANFAGEIKCLFPSTLLGESNRFKFSRGWGGGGLYTNLPTHLSRSAHAAIVSLNALLTFLFIK